VLGGTGPFSGANWPKLGGKGGGLVDWGVGVGVVLSGIGERLVFVRFGGVWKERPLTV
jgi:hypothetical protein